MTEASVLSALKSWGTNEKTWTLIIGLLVWFAAKHGLNLDQTSLWVIAGGFSMLLGGQAFQDHGSTAAKVSAVSSAQQQAATMAHEKEMRSTQFSPLVSAPAVGQTAQKGSVRSAQKGSVRLGVMLAIFTFLTAVFLSGNVGCSSAIGPDLNQAGSDISACASAEAAAVKANVSIMSVTLEVVSLIEQFIANPALAIANLISGAVSTYGEPLVACAFNKYVAQHGGSGSGSASTAQPDPKVLAAKQIIAANHWEKYAK